MKNAYSFSLNMPATPNKNLARVCRALDIFPDDFVGLPLSDLRQAVLNAVDAEFDRVAAAEPIIA